MCCVVIIGMGIILCLGNDLDIVFIVLCEGCVGICILFDYVDVGLCSYVGGNIELDLDVQIDCKFKCFMSDVLVYVYIVMCDVIVDVGLEVDQVVNLCIGLIVGFGGGFSQWQVELVDILCVCGVCKVGLYMVLCMMCFMVLVCLFIVFQIKGLSYLLLVVCVMLVYCIGVVVDLIWYGVQDVMFVGGGEDLYWLMSVMFDVMGVLFICFNEILVSVLCLYDKDCDGFVIVGGGGMLVLEDYDYVVVCGVCIYVELVGYGVIFDGVDMVVLLGEGVVCCMNMVMVNLFVLIDYFNMYGILILLGDVIELKVVCEVFGENVLLLLLIKVLLGYLLGVVSVYEVIYCLLMMCDGFIVGLVNIGELDLLVEGFLIVCESYNVQLNMVMFNSFGFGGINVVLVFGWV